MAEKNIDNIYGNPSDLEVVSLHIVSAKVWAECQDFPRALKAIAEASRLAEILGEPKMILACQEAKVEIISQKEKMAELRQSKEEEKNAQLKAFNETLKISIYIAAAINWADSSNISMALQQIDYAIFLAEKFNQPKKLEECKAIRQQIIAKK